MGIFFVMLAAIFFGTMAFFYGMERAIVSVWDEPRPEISVFEYMHWRNVRVPGDVSRVFATKWCLLGHNAKGRVVWVYGL